MKLTLLIFAFFALVASAQDGLDDVDRLVLQGSYKITKEATACRNMKYKDQLGPHSNRFQSPCVREVQLPSGIVNEIASMRSNELENESDYDQRVTRLAVFHQDLYQVSAGLNLEEIRVLASNFSIGNIQLEGGYKFSGLRISAFIANDKSFESYGEGIVLGDGYDWDREALFPKYLGKLLEDEIVFHIQFEEFVALYPGGGFGVIHHFFITNEKLVYLKHSGWDA